MILLLVAMVVWHRCQCWAHNRSSQNWANSIVKIISTTNRLKMANLEFIKTVPKLDFSKQFERWIICNDTWIKSNSVKNGINFKKISGGNAGWKIRRKICALAPPHPENHGYVPLVTKYGFSKSAHMHINIDFEFPFKDYLSLYLINKSFSTQKLITSVDVFVVYAGKISRR